MDLEPVFLIFGAIVFALFAVIVILMIIKGKQQQRELVELAASRGFDFVPKPESEKKNLLGYLQPTRFINTIEDPPDQSNGVRSLVRGTIHGRPFLFFMHDHFVRTTSSSTGSARTGGGTSSTKTDMNSVQVLVAAFAHPLRIPPIWFKPASRLDLVFVLTGLRRVKLGDPSVDDAVHFFCDTPKFVPGFATPDVLEFCGKLLKWDIVYVDPGYVLLASSGFRGAEWLTAALEHLDRFCKLLESQAPTASG
jgi:hypothetical protein